MITKRAGRLSYSANGKKSDAPGIFSISDAFFKSIPIETLNGSGAFTESPVPATVTGIIKLSIKTKLKDTFIEPFQDGAFILKLDDGKTYKINGEQLGVPNYDGSSGELQINIVCSSVQEI